MDKQKTFFDADDEADRDLKRGIQPCDPNVRSEDVPRLSKQCQQILDALRRRPMTNQELSEISLKYTSRVSDLRAAGYVIVNARMPGGNGLTTYFLKEHA